MSRIISIGTATPSYGVNQETILNYMQYDYADETANRKLGVLFQASAIQQRYSVVPDFDRLKHDNNFFSGQPMPDVEKRISLFKEASVDLCVHAVNNAMANLNQGIQAMGFTHLITVSCTGLHAPGIDSALIKRLGFREDIFHVSLNFIGCNAAFPALKIADSIAKTEVNARILIVCIELCTIHYQSRPEHDNLLSNTLFGDGAAACIVVNDEFASGIGIGGLNINGFSSMLIDQGSSLMGWNVTAQAFQMILSSKIPAFIAQHIDEFMEKTWEKYQINAGTVDCWAIHPGGKKILDAVKDKLMLTDQQLAASYGVLSRFGNMSSATLLFVLEEVFRGLTKQGSIIFALGFGPGMSFDSTWFTYA